MNSPPRSSPTPSPDLPRKRIDGTYVFFLFKYARSNPECPPKFRDYLLNVVLRKGLPLQKTIEHVYFYLRNWEIKKFGLGFMFLEETRNYDLYDMLFPTDGVPPTYPVAHIPEEYLPRRPGPLRVSGISGAFSGPEPGVQRISDETYYDSLNLGLYDDQETLDRLGEGTPTAPEEEGKEKAAVEEPEREVTNQEPLPGSLDDLLRLLDEIPRGPVVEGSLRQIPPRVEQFGVEWWDDSRYKGTRQPPIATRLVHVVNFLCDEDVDRIKNWNQYFQDVVDYLYWLGCEDEAQQIWLVSPPVLNMYYDAIDKAKTHIIYQKHHYDPTPLEITKPPKVPLRSTRLDWLGDVHNWPVITSKASAPVWRNLLPREIYPRPARDAHINWLPYEDPVFGASTKQLLARDEEEWWQRDDTRPIHDHTNLAAIEGNAFDLYTGANRIGWVTFDYNSQRLVLPNQEPVIDGEPENWVKQRAARRAGFQQLLRLYSRTDGNAKVQAQNPWQKLVLPTTAEALRKVRQSRDGPQWAVPRLTPKELGPFVETMPYTISFREHLKKVKRTRMTALLATQLHHGKSRTWTGLPKNIINGGPFVWRTVDPSRQDAEDLLDACHTTLKMLEVASQRDPRELLNLVIQYASEAIEGTWGDYFIPPHVKLASDEIQGRGFPKYVNEEDLEWLKFLSTECKSKGNWTGRFVPDEPRDKYKLFHIFATRVQRLLDDKNPDGLFSQRDARVTVQDLLKTINTPSQGNGPQSFRYTFDPVDACCWLDRMRRSGHIKFDPSPIDYGTVERPRVKHYPEHRVIWPTTDEITPRPQLLSHIVDWKEAINNPQDEEKADEIMNFFIALGFRLGLTINQLEKDRVNWIESGHRPVKLRNLLRSIEKFDMEYEKESGEAGDGLVELVQGINLFQAQEALGIKQKTTNEDGVVEEEAGPEQTPEPKAELEQKALDLIRQKIITEASENLTMLGPGRKKTYFRRADKKEHVALKFDFSWDWASHPGHRLQRKQYWNINRWPVDSGYLSPAANNAVKTKVVHTSLVYDPAKEDSTDRDMWHIPQQERFEQKVKQRWGPPTYNFGDTPYQRKIIEEELTRAANAAFSKLGVEKGGKETWAQALARLNPLVWPRRAAAGERESVDMRGVPQSWDLEAKHYQELLAKRREKRRAKRREAGLPEDTPPPDDLDIEMEEAGHGRVPPRQIQEVDEDSDVSMVEI